MRLNNPEWINALSVSQFLTQGFRALSLREAMSACFFPCSAVCGIALTVRTVFQNFSSMLVSIRFESLALQPVR